MLNELEKRILRYMIEQNSNDIVPIRIDKVDVNYQIEAVRSLAEQGYVVDACTISEARAILTFKGKYYLKEENDMVYGAYSDKITQLEQYISDGERLQKLKDMNKTASYVCDILAVYNNYINSTVAQGIHIRMGLGMSANSWSLCEEELVQTIEILKRILSDTKIEASKQNSPLIQNINTNTFSPTIEQTVNIEITLSNVISDIQKTELSPEERNKLIALLAEVESNKSNKTTLGEKIKNALKYLLDKGIEISAIVLPFLAQTLK